MFGLIKTWHDLDKVTRKKITATQELKRLLSKIKAPFEPCTVFIGGRGIRNRMIVLKRSLKVDDFNQLWSATDVEV